MNIRNGRITGVPRLGAETEVGESKRSYHPLFLLKRRLGSCPFDCGMNEQEALQDEEKGHKQEKGGGRPPEYHVIASP
jgi:hypothetical protein